MAIRLLPFRDYDEHDVVNLFKSAGNLSDFIDLSDAAKRSTPQGDAGVFVTVAGPEGGNLQGDWDPVDVTSNPASLLGKTDYPHVGRNTYPQAALSVAPTAGIATESCIGITLRQTVARDENGENLLYNPVKKDELFGVLPGEAVPVLSKGLITLSAEALTIDGQVGQLLETAADGKAAPIDRGSATNQVIGQILAVGDRDDNAGSQGGKNVFGNAGFQSGKYYIVKIDCA
tara:strand:+ start:2855 stop:3547 length:693 start_codon:yes stop_codon:yes gene_type:complete